MPPKIGGRKQGVPNYDRTTLLNIIEAVMPIGQIGWQTVAERYQTATDEATRRDPTDVKRQFIGKYCKSNKKPTGSSGPSELIREAQAIQARIIRKENAQNYGEDSDAAENLSASDSEAEDANDDYDAAELDEIFPELPANNFNHLCNQTSNQSSNQSSIIIIIITTAHCNCLL